MITPTFTSLVFDSMPAPDFTDLLAIPLPSGTSTDPRVWAEAIFGTAGIPVWVGAALAIRQFLVPLIGIPRAATSVFDVTRVEGEEALIVAPDKHLTFHCAVGVDAQQRLLRVTTAVTLNGWRGKLYFAPVRLAHPVVVRSMMLKASRSSEVRVSQQTKTLSVSPPDQSRADQTMR
ncbi:DUF2867 domain-containing protein [Lysinibacter cavernae]|uniref:DUF2867 domain-containing protein n=1 Tax=Lysinibacter cavernae TaxID=1640652 RepID=A0A7X5TUS2_9MICO|nr:DUF2867 domain-containing protein [Lysinibacter cavernae]NIH54713.1 hypothetical protein [Lysinibacter cavernae]